MHTSTACMHMSANLLPLQQPICSALPPPDSSRSSLLPPQFQVLCTAAHRRTTSSRRHAAATYPARARAPASAGFSRHLEPCLPSLPILLEEARPLTATKCCDRQVAHRHQPRHLQLATDRCNPPGAEGWVCWDGTAQLCPRGAASRGPARRCTSAPRRGPFSRPSAGTLRGRLGV